MNDRKQWLVISFSTTTQALAVEASATADGVAGRLIPLPQQISAGCGLAWKTEPSEKEALIRWLDDNSLRWEAMYELVL